MTSAPVRRYDANRLLARLTDEEIQALQPHFRLMRVRQGHVFFEPGDAISAVNFPLGGVASALTVMREGGSIEAAMVGNEGMVGVSAALGERASFRGVMQMEGDVVSMPIDRLLAAMAEVPRLASTIFRFAGLFLAMIAQSAACNGLHPVSTRLARWLLMVHDRVGDQPLPFTHEFLAQMLGVQRSTVTVEANALQQGGAISYRPGEITVVDRERLERSACECYFVVRERFERSWQ